jgi:hypothetical protein
MPSSICARTKEEESTGTCGICMETGAQATAPCGHAGVRFHTACLIEWCALHARCPHCNACDTSGSVRRLVNSWVQEHESALTCWKRGPLFVGLEEGLVSALSPFLSSVAVDDLAFAKSIMRMADCARGRGRTHRDALLASRTHGDGAGGTDCTTQPPHAAGNRHARAGATARSHVETNRMDRPWRTEAARWLYAQRAAEARRKVAGGETCSVTQVLLIVM